MADCRFVEKLQEVAFLRIKMVFGSWRVVPSSIFIKELYDDTGPGMCDVDHAAQTRNGIWKLGCCWFDEISFGQGKRSDVRYLAGP
jgi:hypothetical protein